MFVRNKSIIKPFLTSNCYFWLKYEFSVLLLKVILCESGEEYAQIKLSLQAKQF